MIDLDNTLVDRAGAVRAWAEEVCDDHGLPPDAVDRLIELDGDGYGERDRMFHELRNRYGVDGPVDELQAGYRARAADLIEPTDGAVDLLRRLRAAGHAVAIVSNGAGDRQRAKIDKLGLGHLVDAICISEELGTAKPDAAIFRTAAEQAGATLTGAWMIGDAPYHDIVGAHRLGLHSVWIRRGRAWDSALVIPADDRAEDGAAGPSTIRPTRTVDSLAELPAPLRPPG